MFKRSLIRASLVNYTSRNYSEISYRQYRINNDPRKLKLLENEELR